MWYDDRDFPWHRWRYVLPVIMLFLSVMMISDVKYPSFKSINLSVQRPFGKLVIATLFVGLMLVLRERILPVVLPLIFTSYLVYGFIRPKVSRKFRAEIEDEDSDETEP
jgi:CDP-diacylglycerol--serine O-phosphatidyltransferase